MTDFGDECVPVNVAPSVTRRSGVFLTDEQSAVVAAGASQSTGAALVVQALAGSGKSTMQRAYAAAYPKRRFLGLTFNRSLADEAKARMPQNVDSTTTHAVAFRAMSAVGAPTFGIQDKLIDEHQPVHVANYLRIGSGNIDYATMVLRHVHRFLISAARDAGDIRVSPDANAEASRLGRSVVVDAAYLYTEMLRPTSALRCTHDAYLKAYQLTNPQWDVDEILCDEWQDANEVTLAMVGSQSAPKVYVGDRHQAIYGFRGSVNAMDQLNVVADPFYLSNSFRFGPEVAAVANGVLSFKGEKVQLIGCGGQDRVGAVDRSGRYAFISRTVGGVFAHAAHVLDARPKVSLYFVGGVDGYRLDELMDVYALSKRERPQNPLLARYHSLDQLTRDAESMRQIQLLSVIRLVHRYGNRVPTIVAAIRNAAQKSAEHADVALTTAHRSKGLEFDSVVIDNNFFSLSDLLEDLKAQGAGLKSISGLVSDPQEINLIYVAATRARKRLELNVDLTHALAALHGATLFGHRTIQSLSPSAAAPKTLLSRQALSGGDGRRIKPALASFVPSARKASLN